MSLHIATLRKYAEVKAELARLKELEMDMRIKIADSIHTSGTGTYRQTVGKANVKIVKKLAYKFDKEKLEDTFDDMTDEERGAIAFDARLLKSRFDKLDEAETLTACLYTQPAAPTVEVTFEED